MVQVLGRELVKQGHSVSVVGLYAYSYGGKDYEVDMGVKVWRFRYGWNLRLDASSIVHKFFNKIPGIIKRHLNGVKAFEKYTNFIKELIKKEQLDIIEIADWNTFAMRIGFSVKWPAFSVPLVLKSHGSYTYFAVEMGTHLKKRLYRIDRDLFERADALSAVSAYTAEKDRQIFGISRGITVLYNAIEKLPAVEVPREACKVVFTGTLMKKKGIYELIRAWNLVHKELPEAKLVVLGKGNIDRLKSLAEPSARETILFKGHVPRTELFGELASATLAVFPSYSETFGLAPLEAMSMGCPVIFTRRASGPEIVEQGVSGELVEPSDIKEIAAAILRILKSKTLQQQYAREGKHTADTKFNISASAQQHIAYYTQIKNTFKKKSNP